ncbi:MAG: UDP-3-O-acyl-N-acetylglucosamine deacetylase [Pseudomonadota bacterium]
MQATLKSAVTFRGTGLHSGLPVVMSVVPAKAGCGILFRRTDVAREIADIPARWDHVEVSPLNTRLKNAAGVTVSTIEHIMAAMFGCGIHNAIVELDGPEVPILDGSSAIFVRGFVNAGLTRQNAPLRAIEVLRDVVAEEGDAYARLTPATTLQIAFDISFADAAIGEQSKALNMANGAFVRELCDSRTFCRAADVEAMRAKGLALGGTMNNAVVVDGDKVLSPGGLRHADEAVRHKMLDALGDLFTAGAPMLGRYEGHKAGHNLTNRLLHQLFSDQGNWRWVTCDPATAARLPGVGVSPADLEAVA